MSRVEKAAAMKKVLRADEVEALLREIKRYLDYVDAFRTAGSRRPRDGKAVEHVSEAAKTSLSSDDGYARSKPHEER